MKTFISFLAAGTMILGSLFSSESQAQQIATPYVRLADLRIAPDQLDAFKAAAARHVAAVLRDEPDVLALHAVAEKDDPSRIRVFEMYKDAQAYAVTLKDAPNQIRFMEIYADEGAYLSHRETPHFKKYLAVTGPMITGRKLTEATALVVSARRMCNGPAAGCTALRRED